MTNIIIIDLETTGLLSDKHEIIEIGAVNTTISETFECKVHPLRIKEADPESLKINGYNKIEWEEAFSLSNALKLLNEFVGVNQPYFMAYNALFDLSFLEKAYQDCALPWPFHYHKLDLLTIAWDRLEKGLSLELKNVASVLGVSPESAVHHALAGAECAYQIYKKLI